MYEYFGLSNFALSQLFTTPYKWFVFNLKFKDMYLSPQGGGGIHIKAHVFLYSY